MKTLSRRRPVVLLSIAAVTVLMACGNTSATDTTNAATVTSTTDAVGSTERAPSATRAVSHELGEVAIPVNPDRILALDEYAALNLLTVGVAPRQVFAFFDDEVVRSVLESEGIEVIPAPSEDPNLEAIAATEPDLIVFTSEAATVEFYEEFSAIAPTVVMPFLQPWREVIQFAGLAFGAEDRSQQVVDELDERLSVLRSELQDAPQSISILGSTSVLWTPAPATPMSAIVEEAGFTRPAAQTSGEVVSTVIMLSPEVLGEHDADTVVVLSGSGYDVDAVTSTTTYQQLPAVREGRSVEVNGDLWFGNHAFAVYWILEDLHAVSRGGSVQDELGTPDDALSRWEDFKQLLG